MADFESLVSGGRHYDNITPCYLGGLQLTGDLIPNKSIALPVDENWYYVAAFPGFSLNTAKARSVLPKELSMYAGVEFAQRLSAFSSLLLTSRFDEALCIMQDNIAEPHRAPLINGFDQAKLSLPELGTSSKLPDAYSARIISATSPWPIVSPTRTGIFNNAAPSATRCNPSISIS